MLKRLQTILAKMSTELRTKIVKIIERSSRPDFETKKWNFWRGSFKTKIESFSNEMTLIYFWQFWRSGFDRRRGPRRRRRYYYCFGLRNARHDGHVTLFFSINVQSIVTQRLIASINDGIVQKVKYSLVQSFPWNGF